MERSPQKVALVVISNYDSRCFEEGFRQLPHLLREQICGIFLPMVATGSGSDLSTAFTPSINEIEKLASATSTPVTTVRLLNRDAQYGSVQKLAFTWALEHEFDVVAVVNGSGHFPFGHLADLVEPIIERAADVVVASRSGADGLSSRPNEAVRWYKRRGNEVLSKIANRLVGTKFDDWHCAYRAFSRYALTGVPFGNNSESHVFDFEVMIQLLEGGYKIHEMPLPIEPDDSFGVVDCLRFATDALFSSVRYRSHKMGFGTGTMAFNSLAYELKFSENTSHSYLLGWIHDHGPARVLDIGCSDGRFGELVESMGCSVTGVDTTELPGVRERISEFHEADLDLGLHNLELHGPFDVIVAADVLEHLRDPEALLLEMKGLLSDDGLLLVSVPNLSHWYGRMKVGMGLFSYDRRGLFDAGHLRFFTPVSFRRMAKSAGLEVVSTASTNTPIVDVVVRGRSGRTRSSDGRQGTGLLPTMLEKAAALCVQVWPSLFSYQLLFKLRETRRGNRKKIDFIEVGPKPT